MPNAVIVVTTPTGAPQRMLFGDDEFVVTDMPTRLEDIFSPTHPLPVDGWRFQGTDATGRSWVFDVRLDHRDQRWYLLRQWD